MQNLKYNAEKNGLITIAQIINENIDEEFGIAYDSTLLKKANIEQSQVHGVAHYELLSNFLSKMDHVLLPEEKKCIDMCIEKMASKAAEWRNVYIKASMKSLEKGIGAIGLGCELILQRCLRFLLRGSILIILN